MTGKEPAPDGLEELIDVVMRLRHLVMRTSLKSGVDISIKVDDYEAGNILRDHLLASRSLRSMGLYPCERVSAENPKFEEIKLCGVTVQWPRTPTRSISRLGGGQ